jgi:HlyD family secretion protein
VLQELKPGQTRKEIEGVFVVVNNHATFTPVTTGIAGEKYFEIVKGLKEGDEVITGPFASVRNLKEGDEVKVSNTPAGATTTKAAGGSS